MELRVEAFSPSHREDFFEFHTRVGGECFCTAWWVPTWQEYMDASPEDTRRLREELLKQGQYDGYLLYADDKMVGWCQAGQRDRLGKLLGQFSLDIDPKTWAITCFQIDPDFQRKGLAEHILKEVLAHLSRKGVKRVEAYPKIDISLPGHQQWTGPRSMYEKAGFALVRENNTRAVYVIRL